MSDDGRALSEAEQAEVARRAAFLRSLREDTYGSSLMSRLWRARVVRQADASAERVAEVPRLPQPEKSGEEDQAFQIKSSEENGI